MTIYAPRTRSSVASAARRMRLRHDSKKHGGMKLNAARGEKDKIEIEKRKVQSKQSKSDVKTPWNLPLLQKPSGVWSYRFSKAFRKLRQISISDYHKDPETGGNGCA